MESQTRSAIAARNFGSTQRWKGKQRANVHYLYERGMSPDEISHLIGLPVDKIVATIRSITRKGPIRPVGWSVRGVARGKSGLGSPS